MAIRVMLISEIRLYREALERALQGGGDLQLLGSAATGAEALRQCARLDPDVALVDMAMGQPLEGVAAVLGVSPGTKVVALTVAEDEVELIQLAEVGVIGYVTRKGSLTDIILSIEAAVKGELHCSAAAAGSLMRRVADLSSTRFGDSVIDCLTRRELHILDLVEQGLSNKEIARAASIEVATVKNHIHNILEKLGLRRRGEAAALLRRVAPLNGSSTATFSIGPLYQASAPRGSWRS